MKVKSMTFDYLLPTPIKVGQIIIRGLIIESRLPDGLRYDIEDLTKEVSKQNDRSVK